MVGLRSTFCVLVAQGRGAHVCDLDRALAVAVHKRVALCRMKLGRCDHLGQLLHICRLNVHNLYAVGYDIEDEGMRPQRKRHLRKQ